MASAVRGWCLGVSKRQRLGRDVLVEPLDHGTVVVARKRFLFDRCVKLCSVPQQGLRDHQVPFVACNDERRVAIRSFKAQVSTARGQYVNDSVLAQKGRSVQRAIPFLVFDVGVSAMPQETLHHVSVPAGASNHHGCFPTCARHIRVSSVRDNPVNHLGLPELARHNKRRHASLVGGVEVSLVRRCNLEQREVPVSHSDVNHIQPIVGPSIDIRAVASQPVDNVLVPSLRRAHQRCLAVEGEF
mmetsp:Transcript_20563/g.48070  ORF Transcript_20563/g.48070 Transcript_20563/m.48070 type:complete len:243 (-) Transcript_20563:283-1011(-)